MNITSTTPQIRLDFTKVPNDLINSPKLTMGAKMVLVYALSKPAGWTLRVTDIRDALGISDYTWRRISRELRATRCLIVTQVRSRFTGRVSENTMTFSIDPIMQIEMPLPDPTFEESSEVYRNVEIPKVGKPTGEHVDGQRDDTSTVNRTSKIERLRKGSDRRAEKEEGAKSSQRPPKNAARGSNRPNGREAPQKPTRRSANPYDTAENEELYKRFRAETGLEGAEQFKQWCLVYEIEPRPAH